MSNENVVQPNVDVINLTQDLLGEETAKKFEGECLLWFWKFSIQKG